LIINLKERTWRDPRLQPGTPTFKHLNEEAKLDEKVDSGEDGN
jgi:hypothetical protein